MADMVASQVHMISTHKGDVTCLAFNTSTLATTSGDKTIRLWSMDNFSELPYSPLLGHSYIIHHCTFSPFGTLLATCSTDGKLILWDVKTGKVQAQFQHKSKTGIRVCKFSPDSTRIASGSDDDTICIWEIASQKLLRSFTGLEDSVVAMDYSPDGHFLVSGSPNGDLYVWDAEFGHGRYLSLKVDAHDLGVTCCQFSPSFGTASTSASGVVQLLLATGGKDHLLKLWTFAAQVGSPEVLLKCHASLPGHSDIVMSCAFSPSGEILASGSFDKSLRLWDPLKGVALFSIDDCHSRFVTCCAFSLDGSMVATGSMDRTVKVWKLTDTSTIMDGLKGYEEPEAVEASPVVVSHPVENLTVEEVAQWVTGLGLSQYAQVFTTNAIDGRELLALTSADLQTHLGITALGHRNKILRSRDQGVISLPEETTLSATYEVEESVKLTAAAGEKLKLKFSPKAPSPVVASAPPLVRQAAETPSMTITSDSRPSPQWSVQEVVQWLEVIGLSQYKDSFKHNAIDGKELLALTDSELNTSLGVGAFGHRNKILRSRHGKDKENLIHNTASSTGLVKSVRSNDTSVDQSELCCPISMAIMRDPVIAADGYTYDRQAIKLWLESGNQRSPMTNAVLAHKNLTPNRTLKMLIQRHLDQAGK